MRACFITMMCIGFGASALLSERVYAEHARSDLMGLDAIELYDCTGAVDSRCLDGVQLTFGSSNRAALLGVEFVVREDNGHLPTAPQQIRVLVTPLARTSVAQSGVMFRVRRQQYPLATIADQRGFVVALMPFEAFVHLANGRTLSGVALGERFTLTVGQMAVLRSVATRWATHGTTF